MDVDRAQITTELRARGANDRADWVERTLPTNVDIDKNRALLDMLGIDPQAMSPVGITT